MQSVVDFGLDVHEYLQRFPQLDFPRPQVCPLCGEVCPLHSHGSYQRRVCCPEGCSDIPIQRLRCSICGRTVSLLPSFCLPFRHYLARIIEAVLVLRLQAGRSWSQLRALVCHEGLPAWSTLRQWVGSFRCSSEDYLGLLLKQLADWQLGPGKLELLLDDLPARGDSAPRLLAAAGHLWVWLVEQGWARLGQGRGWLSVLCQWGGWRGLRRLL